MQDVQAINKLWGAVLFEELVKAQLYQSTLYPKSHAVINFRRLTAKSSFSVEVIKIKHVTGVVISPRETRKIADKPSSNTIPRVLSRYESHL
jgi:hypothetical protein